MIIYYDGGAPESTECEENNTISYTSGLRRDRLAIRTRKGCGPQNYNSVHMHAKW